MPSQSSRSTQTTAPAPVLSIPVTLTLQLSVLPGETFPDAATRFCVEHGINPAEHVASLIQGLAEANAAGQSS